MAADMGGMGFISVAECEVLRNNALIILREGDSVGLVVAEGME